MRQPNTFHYHPHPNPLWDDLDKQLTHILSISNSSTMEPVSRMKMSGDDSSSSLRGQVLRCDRFLLPSHGANLPEGGCPVGFLHLMAWRLHGQGDSCATSTSSGGCRASAGSWHPELCLAKAKLTTKLFTGWFHRAVLELSTFSCAAWRVQKVILPTALPLQAILPVRWGCEGWNSREPSPWQGTALVLSTRLLRQLKVTYEKSASCCRVI